MTAKEFYELNKGKYFMYGNEKIRVVGYGSQSVIICKKKGGWKFRDRDNVDRSLLHDGEKGWYVHIEDLMPIAQQELNLCEILEGCEGVELWSDIFGKCKLISVNNTNSYKILVSVYCMDENGVEFQAFTKYGRYYDCYPNGKCILWPSEKNRDWSTFKKPIKIKKGTHVMCSNGDGWFLREYAGGKEVALDEGKLVGATVTVKYIVPATEFDFTDIESNKSKSII